MPKKLHRSSQQADEGLLTPIKTAAPRRRRFSQRTDLECMARPLQSDYGAVWPAPLSTRSSATV